MTQDSTVATNEGTQAEVTAVTPPAKKSVAKKAAAKKAAAKKVAVKKVAAKKAVGKKTTETSGKPGRPRAEGILWTEKRLGVIKAMKKLQAVSETSAKTAPEIAARNSILTEKDVVHYCWKDHELVTEGYVKQVRHEGNRRIHYYLTAKGQKVETN